MVEKVNLDDLPEIIVPDKSNDNNLPFKKLDNPTDPKDCPPALQQIRKYINKHPDKVILTELGKFYELYFENADEFAPKLNLKVTKRNFSQAKVSMAGFPTQYCYKYIDQLVNVHNVGVVLIKQYLQNPGDLTATKKFKRKLYRIFTPGTIIEPDILAQDKNNYILMINFPDNLLKGPVNNEMKIGLSWCDISTTEFFVQQTSMMNLINDLYRIKPSEIIINEELKLKLQDELNLSILNYFYVNWFKIDNANLKLSNYHNMFNEKKSIKIDQTFNALNKYETMASLYLLEYIKQQFESPDEEDIINSRQDNLNINGIDENSFNFSLPVKNNLEKFMLIDSSAREALEITESIKSKSTKNSVYSTIKRTITPSGSRLLRNWLNNPIYNLNESKKRLNFVKIFQHMNNKSNIQFQIQHQLKSLANYDPLRLLFSISFNSNAVMGNFISNDNANVRIGWNYLILLKILKHFKNIKLLLIKYDDEIKSYDELKNLIKELEFPIELMENIKRFINHENLENLHNSLIDQEESIDQEEEEETPANNNGKDSINGLSYNMKRSSFPDMTWIINVANIDKDSSLVKLHEDLEELLTEKDKLEKKLLKTSDSLQIKNLELRIENDLPNIYIQYPIKSKLTNQLLQDSFEISTTFKQSKSSRSFSTNDWTALGYKISKTIKLTRFEELKFLKKLRLQVLENFQIIKNLTMIIDKLDVLVSFSNLANELNLSCPTLTKKPVLSIVNGRHLTVENSLKKNVVEFQPNDCFLNNQVSGYIISGPNMGGKSTYLRQNAIIIILSHIGCFIPADSATIGIVDKMFTRIGSADDITSNNSTFMVEMDETSHGLSKATKNSFLIFDEIGRGTSNNEGIALAFGILKFIIKNLNCRFLFATHYANELNRLIEIYDTYQRDKLLPNIEYYHTSLMNELLMNYLNHQSYSNNGIFNGRFFNHKLQKGINKYSHATTVAALARIPREVIEDAEIVLKILENKNETIEKELLEEIFNK